MTIANEQVQQINISVQNRHIQVNAGEKLFVGNSPIHLGRQLVEEMDISPAIAIEVGIALERAWMGIRNHEYVDTAHIRLSL